MFGSNKIGQSLAALAAVLLTSVLVSASVGPVRLPPSVQGSTRA